MISFLLRYFVGYFCDQIDQNELNTGTRIVFLRRCFIQNHLHCKSTRDGDLQIFSCVDIVQIY